MNSTYDIYKAYVKPTATSKDLIRMSHYTTLGFGCFMGVLAIVLNEIGISLGYLYLLMGVLLSPAGNDVPFLISAFTIVASDCLSILSVPHRLYINVEEADCQRR